MNSRYQEISTTFDFKLMHARLVVQTTSKHNYIKFLQLPLDCILSKTDFPDECDDIDFRPACFKDEVSRHFHDLLLHVKVKASAPVDMCYIQLPSKMNWCITANEDDLVPVPHPKTTVDII